MATKRSPAVKPTAADPHVTLSGHDGKPLSMTDRAFDTIQRRIVHLELAPGRTFTEGELAAELGMSKTPIREALRVLQVKGFVRAAPRSGWIITPMTLRDAQHLYEMRRLLEPASTKLAAERGLCDTHVKQLRTWASLTVDTSERDSLDTFLEAYGHWSVVVAVHSGNPLLANALHDVCIAQERLFRLAVVMFEPQVKLTDYWKQLVGALIDGDAPRACELVEQHITDERRMVIDALLESDAIQGANVTLG
jgi:DNA-binding GntR family transcriptional regulator